MTPEPHRCVAGDVRRWNIIAKQDKDGDLLHKMKAWKEFSIPLSENDRVWRLFCGIIRREAHRRGLEVIHPPPK